MKKADVIHVVVSLSSMITISDNVNHNVAWSSLDDSNCARMRSFGGETYHIDKFQLRQLVARTKPISAPFPRYKGDVHDLAVTANIR